MAYSLEFPVSFLTFYEKKHGALDICISTGVFHSSRFQYPVPNLLKHTLFIEFKDYLSPCTVFHFSQNIFSGELTFSSEAVQH